MAKLGNDTKIEIIVLKNSFRCLLVLNKQMQIKIAMPNKKAESRFLKLEINACQKYLSYIFSFNANIALPGDGNKKSSFTHNEQSCHKTNKNAMCQRLLNFR
jgi:hypothetical protein